MKINKNYILRDVGGRCVAVPVGSECKKFSGVIKLNETAKMIWKSIESGHTEDETVSIMTEKYEVTPEHAREAYKKTIEIMLEIGVIEK